MINEFSTAAISLLFFFGIGQSNDEKAASIKAESAFQCSQINRAAGDLDHSAVNKMIDLSLRRLDKAYTGDSTIEQFYQARLRGDIPKYPYTDILNIEASVRTGGLERYKNLYYQEIIDTCIEKPKLGLLEAATQALNETYKLTTTTPIYALCNAYNKGTVTYQSLVSLAVTPSMSGFLAGITQVQKDPAYGDKHLEMMISEQCAVEPMQPALETMFTSAHQTIRKARAEAHARAQAEWQAQQEIERQEREQYYQEQKRLKAEHEISLLTNSLYDDSNSEITCRKLNEQVLLASENNNSNVGLIKTFADGFTRLNLEPNKQQAIISSLEDDRLRLISLSSSHCKSNPSYSFESVLRRMFSLVAYTIDDSIASPEEKNSASSASKNTTFNRRAVINDSDGYTNVRSQADTKSPVIARIVEGEQFETLEQTGNWWKVRTQQGKTGYMHASRISLLD